MNQYAYDGPVMSFDRCVAQHWTGSTYASTEKKALSNLVYQYKKQNKLMPTAKITLTGKLTLVE